MITANKKNTDKTILTISVGFLLVYLFSNWNWALVVTLSVGLIGIFSNYLSQKIEWVWLQISKLLSYIVPNILLSLVFYFVLFPVAILSRIFGKKDTLQIKNGKPTYYIATNKKFGKDDFTYPW
jgi:hypothetical protein